MGICHMILTYSTPDLMSFLICVNGVLYEERRGNTRIWTIWTIWTTNWFWIIYQLICLKLKGGHLPNLMVINHHFLHKKLLGVCPIFRSTLKIHRLSCWFLLPYANIQMSPHICLTPIYYPHISNSQTQL